MFDQSRGSMLQEVRTLSAALAAPDSGLAGLDDAQRIDLLRALEELKCAAEAAQAEVTADLDTSQRARHAERGVPGAQRGRGIAAQVGLARRESPHRGAQHLGLARILRDELPCTRAAFRAGKITEWRAMVIARETACLSVEDRRTVDRAIAGDPDALEGYSDRVLFGELRKLAAKLDPAAVAARRRRAESERCVTTRPAPDTMGYLTALLPVAQMVACYAALKKATDAAIADGDQRSRGQLMADLLVSRLTGAPDVDGRPVVTVEVGLVMTDQALFDGAHDTAHLAGFGPIPAGLGRQLLADQLDAGTRTWLRRLYTHPTTGELVAMDSRARLFRGRLAEFIALRDQFCRNAWCNAPIRHTDHVTPAAAGGPTTADGGQGLCEDCNYTKQAPGWTASSRSSPGTSPGHTVETTTPTGHTYTSHAPPVLGLRRGAYQHVADGLWTLIA